LVAVHNLGGDEPRITKHRICFRNPPGGKRGADWAGTHRPSRVLEPRHDIDRKAELCALGCEIVRGACAIEAEMKIEADGDTCDVKACEENATNKVLRGQAGERRVEAQHDRAGKSGRGQEPQLRALVGEAEQRLLGSEETARMRLEGERRGWPGE